MWVIDTEYVFFIVYMYFSIDNGKIRDYDSTRNLESSNLQYCKNFFNIPW